MNRESLSKEELVVRGNIVNSLGLDASSEVSIGIS